MIDFKSTEISQYANSPIILALIEKFNDAIDPSNLLDNFYNNVWNLETAGSYGLDLWGKRVGISRVVYLPNITTEYVGFDEAHSWLSWGFAQWWGGDQTGTSQKYILSDTEYRILIKAKAAANISDCSIKSINYIIQSLFGSNSYVVDNGDMTMTLVFITPLNLTQLSILLQSDVIPRPMGVGSYIINGITTAPQLIISRQVF